jgi:hypothetical protein
VIDTRLLWGVVAAVLVAGRMVLRLRRLQQRSNVTVVAKLQHPTIKVFVKTSGAIVLNGNQIETSAFGPILAHVKVEEGRVYYAREAGQSEPTQAQYAVFDQIAAVGVPIGLFTNETFSTPVAE